MAVNPVSLGVQVALAAANMAVNAMQTIEGPRVTGNPATVADYGTPLNYFLGQRLLACPCFFAKPIVEKKKKRKGKGGKKVEYTAYGSWAVHVADHAIGGIQAIWFDNHLVYGFDEEGTKTYPLGEGYELAANLRIYTGSESQNPDPDMAAYIAARDGQSGTCPAYRGTSYIYFENIPLEMLGNRYPDVRVMASFQTAAALCFALDRSGSMSGERLATMKEALQSVLANVATAIAGGATVDLCAIGWGTAASTITRRSASAGDVEDVDAFIQALTASGGTNFSAAANAAETFFNGTDEEIAARALFFVTDGEAGDDPAAAGATIFALEPPVQSYGINIILENTADTAQVDNTPGDGVPVVSGEDPSGLADAVHAALFGGVLGGATLSGLLGMVAQRSGLEPGEYDFSAVAGQDYRFAGFNWTQATGRQICEALCDLYDVDLRPHDFTWQALPRGSASAGALETGEFVAGQDGSPPFTLTDTADGDLPRRVFLTYADTDSGQQPNVAMPPGPAPGAAGTVREAAIDMQTLALAPGDAQNLAERWLRRQRFGRVKPELALTRRRIALEPGDVMIPGFDGEAMVARLTKLTLGADGAIATEWERDDPAIASLSGSAGAIAAGWVDDAIPDPIATLGLVLDLPLLADAHEQSAPLAYLAAGPEGPGVWTGASFAQSEAGELDSYVEDWDGIAAGDGAVIGECADALPVALPWVPDLGSSVEVTINQGALTAATLDDLLLDPTRNLAAIQSGDGWELVQFLTPELTGALTYTITGFLRGVRGTEWAIGGHAAGDRFVLLDGTAKLHTMGAAEIGDTDYYIVSTFGQIPDEADEFSLAFAGVSHKPYAPINPVVTQDGADWLYSATRRTRVGGAALNGQDVPLGETAESWSLDIMDGPTVVRTITGGSLPLTYTEADQIADWGAPLGANPEANLHQVSPPLSLRGYPLNFPAGA